MSLLAMTEFSCRVPRRSPGDEFPTLTFPEAGGFQEGTERRAPDL